MRWTTTIFAASLLLALPACGGGYSAWAVTTAGATTVDEPAPTGGGGAGHRRQLQRQVEFSGADVAGDIVDSGTTAAGESAPPEERYAQATPTAEGDEEPATASDGRSGPLLVYTAEVALAVHQVQDKLERIETLANESGGHLAQRTGDTIRIRVPSSQFQPVLDAILELGDVLQRDVRVDDVTEEFRDVQLRIRTLEAMYQRVQQMLQNAQDMEQALAIEQHLERITMDLERMRGRLRFLSDQLAFSTITVRFTERTEVSEPQFELPFAWLRSLGLPSLLRLR